MKKLILFFFIGVCGYSQNAKVSTMYIPNNYMTQPSIANYEDDIFIASTVSNDFSNTNSEINVIKKSQSGNLAWSKNFFNDKNLFVGSIKFDKLTHELVLTGYLNDNFFKRLFIMVLDANGNLLRQQIFSDDLFPNFNLYGTDVEVTDGANVDSCLSDARNYIITGFGAANSSHTASKFAFVASISGSLETVNWFKKYDSGSVTLNGNDFDSFNSVRSIYRNGQKLFMVTGSGVDNGLSASMATIDLIDVEGNSIIWGNGKGIYEVIGTYEPFLNDTFGKYSFIIDIQMKYTL